MTLARERPSAEGLGDGFWWSNAAIYQVYVRSFMDADGDGVGDLEGLRSRLPHLAALGVDAVWLTPVYRSPMVDHGYDVADPRAIDPLFGSLDDLDDVVSEAHRLRLRVLLDVVPNHTSDRHAWFQEAAADPTGAAAARYVIRHGRDGGEAPPNGWTSRFGGPAWTRFRGTDRWYLHLYSPHQPDLDWRNPDVVADFETTLAWWFDRGVDGVRIDVAHGLVKDDLLRDAGPDPSAAPWAAGSGEATHAWAQPGVLDLHRRWRALADQYDEPRLLLGEVWLDEPDALAAYTAPGGLDAVFGFPLMFAPWSAEVWRRVLVQSLDSGATLAWALGNHDVVRAATRYGGGAVGRRRAVAAALVVQALPGISCVYQGDELALPEVQLPRGVGSDPSGGPDAPQPPRDGCRVPMPWAGDDPPFGFTAGTPWLPMPSAWDALTVARQELDPWSPLHVHRRAIAARRRLDPAADVEVLPLRDGSLVLRRGQVTVAINMGGSSVEVPGHEVVVASSADVVVAGGCVQVPPDSAAWILSPR